MLNLELSRLLGYLATGEDEGLVLGLLQSQPGAPELLAEARVALELLGPQALNPQVRRRLEVAREAALGRRGTAKFAPRLQLRPVDAPFVDAIRAGARQFVALGSLMLDRDSSQPIRSAEPPAHPSRPDMSPAPDNDLPALLARDDAGSLYGDPSGRPSMRAVAGSSPFRVRVPGGGALVLRHEVRNAVDYLSVRLEGQPSAPGAMQVTWLPDQGDIGRVFTDGSGEATLPWPAVGHGILRIDAGRTLECELLVRL